MRRQQSATMPHVTVRERLIDLLRDAGYDYFTAAEHVHSYLAEFRASADQERTITCGGRAAVLRKRAAPPG